MLSEEQLKTAVAAGQALPGPAQIIVAAQISYYLKGVRGTLVAMPCYLLPSLVITLLFCFVYFNYFASSNLARFTTGIEAAVGGIIVGNAYKIARQIAQTNLLLWALVILVAFLSYTSGLPPLMIIFASGIAGTAFATVKGRLIK